MSAYNVKSHPVTAVQITLIGPLMAQGKMMAPNAGLMLILDDQSKSTHRWLSEKDGHIPVIGDWFIKDDELQLSFIIPAAKFADLFTEV